MYCFQINTNLFKIIFFQALRNNETLTELSMANTTLGDYGAANLAAALEANATLQKLNIESNNVSPQCLVKIFEVIFNNSYQVIFYTVNLKTYKSEMI